MSVNINEEKVMLRNHYRDMRKKMTKEYKRNLDIDIAAVFLMSDEYVKADHILIYAATEYEIETRNIVRASLAAGKKVSMPRCNEDGTMRFYSVDSLSDLKKGSFNIFEPEANDEKLAKDFENSLCVVPGLAFDPNGNRLGYGGGYYDKFLSNFCGVSVGLCYGSFVKWSVPTDKNDVPVDYLLTDAGVRKTH